MPEKEQRIVITGSTGFIGSSLIDTLQQRGFTQILTLDRNPVERPDIKSIRCDIFVEKDILIKYIEPGDTLVHLACGSLPASDIRELEKNHSELAELLLQVCVEKGVSKFLFPSSGGTVYGEGGQEGHLESDILSPQNPYAIAKVNMEKILYSYKEKFGLPVCILRISNPYGRKNLRDEKVGAVDIFLRKAIAKEPITIWGDGENIRDYIYINDVLDFILLSIEKENQGIYNIGSGVGTSLNQIIELIRNISGEEIKVIKKNGRQVDIRHNTLNIDKAIKTGWRPKSSLQQGLNELYLKITNNKSSQ